MDAKAEGLSSTAAKTRCGECSCVILYKGDFCLFCDAASEILANSLQEYGVSESALMEVDVDDAEACGCNTDGITMLPTIKICDVKLTGLPEQQSVNDAVIRAIMKDCFVE
ncbi:MAG: hypothetical protein ACP6KW_10800 [Candidatus Thorarchaeota archaeon]